MNLLNFCFLLCKLHMQPTAMEYLSLEQLKKLLICKSRKNFRNQNCYLKEDYL